MRRKFAQLFKGDDNSEGSSTAAREKAGSREGALVEGAFIEGALAVDNVNGRSLQHLCLNSRLLTSILSPLQLNKTHCFSDKRP